jgi:hypothetical protein
VSLLTPPQPKTTFQVAVNVYRATFVKTHNSWYSCEHVEFSRLEKIHQTEL